MQFTAQQRIAFNSCLDKLRRTISYISHPTLEQAIKLARFWAGCAEEQIGQVVKYPIHGNPHVVIAGAHGAVTINQHGTVELYGRYSDEDSLFKKNPKLLTTIALHVINNESVVHYFKVADEFAELDELLAGASQPLQVAAKEG
jgi:hypothetical protein